jgi:hypothetical protein
MAGREITELDPTSHARERASEYGLGNAAFIELLRSPYRLVRNPKGRGGSHRLIGRTMSGRCLVVPIVATDHPGIWRAITVWPCDEAAAKLLR